MKPGQVALRSLVVAGGHAPPVPEPVDAAFDGVALLVQLGVMTDGTAALRAALLAVGRLVRLLRNYGADLASSQVGAVAAGGGR